MKATNVGDPIAFSSELNIMFDTPGIHNVHLQATLSHKSVMPANIPLLQNFLFPFHDPSGNTALNQLPFCVAQRKKGFKVIDKGVGVQQRYDVIWSKIEKKTLDYRSFFVDYLGR